MAKGKASKAIKQRPNQPAKAGTTLDSAHRLRQAANALAGGQVDVACQILSQTRDARATPEGRELLASAFAAQACERWDKPARALGSLERALEAAPADAELRRLRGTLLRRAGRLRAALAELDQAHRLAPGDASVALEGLLAHAAAGDRGPQLAALADRVGPGAKELAAGVLAAGEGDLSTAERALARAPQPPAKVMRAILLLAKGETHAALPALRQAAADDTQSSLARAYANFYLGLAHVRRRELQPAAQALEKALWLGLPRDLVGDHLAWVYNQLVIDAVLAEDLAGAVDRLTQLSEVGGPAAQSARENVAYALRLCGQEKAQAGDYDEAARLWARALEVTPRDFVLRQNLAVALERADRADEAIPHWHELVQQLAKGTAKAGKGQREGPVAVEDEALGVHVRAVAHRHLADLYLEEDDLERAIAQLERVLAVLPDDGDTRLELAGLFLAVGSPRKAIPHLERLAVERPESPEIFVELGAAQRILGDLDATVRALERAYALAPDSPLISMGLGTSSALRALKSPAAPTAEDDVRRALELLPRGKFAGLAALGAVRFAQGKREEAIKALKRCVKEASDKAQAAIEAGHVYWQAGERKSAFEASAAAAKKAKRSPDLWSDLAVAWAKAGDVERCQECFKQLLSRRFEAVAIDAASAILNLPQGAATLRRALNELVPWAPDTDALMFLTEGLLRAGDIASARPLMNRIAVESMETHNLRGLLFAMDLDYKYKYKLLDHRTAATVAGWVEANRPRNLPGF